MNKNKAILFGVCGIGRGHIYETMPFIEEYLSRKYKVAIFSFGESYEYFLPMYKDHERVLVIKVNVPWVHGSLTGIDFKMTADEKINKDLSFYGQNFGFMKEVIDFMGIPSIVITNYEPASAVFSYATQTPLITLGQTSKYLIPGFPNIGNYSSMEESARLNLFFPRAKLRIVNSFFKFYEDSDSLKKYNIVTYGPIIRDSISEMGKDDTIDKGSVLVYLSPLSEFVLSVQEMLTLLSEFSNFRFYLYSSRYNEYKVERENKNIENVYVRKIGSENFSSDLIKSNSVICTAGHTLLSELMYLNKPVLAIPIKTYEQHYNAHVINKYKFGKSSNGLNKKVLEIFLDNLDQYRNNIKENKEGILLKGVAQKQIINAIDSVISEPNYW